MAGLSKLQGREAVLGKRKQREGAVGVSSREAVGEVVPEHWTELSVGFNGDPSVIGERREHAPLSAGFSRSQVVPRTFVRPEPKGSGRFCLREPFESFNK